MLAQAKKRQFRRRKGTHAALLRVTTAPGPGHLPSEASWLAGGTPTGEIQGIVAMLQ